MLSVKRKRNLDLGWIGLVVILTIIHDRLANSLEVVINRGVSFGWQVPVVEIILVLVLGYWWWRKGQLGWADKGVSLILAGGWVNLIDRLRFGYVRDYWIWKWFYNNIADWVIGLGVVWMLIKFNDREDQNNLPK